MASNTKPRVQNCSADLQREERATAGGIVLCVPAELSATIAPGYPSPARTAFLPALPSLRFYQGEKILFVRSRKESRISVFFWDHLELIFRTGFRFARAWLCVGAKETYYLKLPFVRNTSVLDGEFLTHLFCKICCRGICVAKKIFYRTFKKIEDTPERHRLPDTSESTG